MDQLKISNDLLKEHLNDLCMDSDVLAKLNGLTPQQKSAFTRAYNKEHKEPVAVKKGKKTAAEADEDEEEVDELAATAGLNEDEIAELKAG